jgi:hypothetical protein
MTGHQAVETAPLFFRSAIPSTREIERIAPAREGIRNRDAQHVDNPPRLSASVTAELRVRLAGGLGPNAIPGDRISQATTGHVRDPPGSRSRDVAGRLEMQSLVEGEGRPADGGAADGAVNAARPRLRCAAA